MFKRAEFATISALFLFSVVNKFGAKNLEIDYINSTL